MNRSVTVPSNQYRKFQCEDKMILLVLSPIFGFPILVWMHFYVFILEMKSQYITRNMHTVRSLLSFGNGWFTHLLQGYISGTGAIIWLPQCQWNNPEEYGWIDHMCPLGLILSPPENRPCQNMGMFNEIYYAWHPGNNLNYWWLIILYKQAGKKWWQKYVCNLCCIIQEVKVIRHGIIWTLKQTPPLSDMYINSLKPGDTYVHK